MHKKVLITGATGFAGSHLAEELLKNKNVKVFGTYLSEKSLENIQVIKDSLQLHKLDLTMKERVISLVNTIKPDVIYHLAALSAVGTSFNKPLETIINNVAAQLHILEAVRETNLPSCRILIISSADVYGKVDQKDIPVDEETRFNPSNTYAVSKITQDFLALQYFNSFKCDIVRARPFNHIGPRQTSGFVVADFAKKIAEIEKGISKPELLVGNLTPKRDFTDVRDMVKAYILLMEKGESGEAYNIGSGNSYRISDILERLLSFSRVKISFLVDQSLVRQEDVPDRRCDNTKIKELTGWEAKIPIGQTLKETLDYWRVIV